MIWFLIFIALQVADVVTTQLILKRGGSELNPVLRVMFYKTNPLVVMIVVKSVLCVGVFFAQPIVAQILCAVYTIVILFNLRSLK